MVGMTLVKLYMDNEVRVKETAYKASSVAGRFGRMSKEIYRCILW